MSNVIPFPTRNAERADEKLIATLEMVERSRNALTALQLGQGLVGLMRNAQVLADLLREVSKAPSEEAAEEIRTASTHE